MLSELCHCCDRALAVGCRDRRTVVGRAAPHSPWGSVSGAAWAPQKSRIEGPICVERLESSCGWVDRQTQIRHDGPNQQGEHGKMIETATKPPEPQRLRALERANEVRLARAELKRRIANGAISAADVILAPPKEARSWAVGDLLLSQRRWGATRCRKFLVRNQVSETKPLDQLTERQRRLLAGQLGSRASHGLGFLHSEMEPRAADRDLAAVGA